MDKEFGKPDGSDFKAESNDTPEEVKANQDDEKDKPLSLFELIQKHTGGESKDSDEEDEPKDLGENLASLFETEPDEAEDEEAEPEDEESPETAETEEPALDEVEEEEELVTPEVPVAAVSEEESAEAEEPVPEAVPALPVLPVAAVETPVAAEEPGVETEPISAEEPDELESELPPLEEAAPEVAAEAEPEPEDEEEVPARAASTRGTVPGAPVVPVVVPPVEAATGAAAANRTGNALGVVGAVAGLYGAHKARQARREVGAEQNAREAADKELSEQQAQQQVEFNRQLAEIKGAQDAAFAAGAEQAAKVAQEKEKLQSEKLAETNQDNAKPVETELVKRETGEQMPIKPEQEEKKMATAEQGNDTEQQATKQTEKVESIGDIIAAQNRTNREVELEAKAATIPNLSERSNSSYLDAREMMRAQVGEKAPETEPLLNQTEWNAEHKAAQEKQYELQHEIKDNDLQMPGSLSSGLSAPISAQDLFAKDATTQHAINGQYVKTTAELTKEAELKDKTSHTYKRAMYTGAVGAAAVLLGIALWALL